MGLQTYTLVYEIGRTVGHISCANLNDQIQFSKTFHVKLSEIILNQS